MHQDSTAAAALQLPHFTHRLPHRQPLFSFYLPQDKTLPTRARLPQVTP
ncbi:hypothetical protein [Chitinophaga sp.]